VKNLLKPSHAATHLKSIQRNIAYLSRQYARIKSLERKKDTRRKIELGGLIKKAGLDEEATAVLYGLLLEAKEKIEGKDKDYLRKGWRLRGDLAFTREKEGW
jgi:tRNA C32,U32 (ribose-2'-O)-methylase TrmJ